MPTFTPLESVRTQIGTSTTPIYDNSGGSNPVYIPGVLLYGNNAADQTVVLSIGANEIDRVSGLAQDQKVDWGLIGGLVIAAGSSLNATTTSADGVIATLTPLEITP